MSNPGNLSVFLSGGKWWQVVAIIPLIGGGTRYLPERIVWGRFTLERVGIRGWKLLPNFYLFLPIPPLIPT